MEGDHLTFITNFRSDLWGLLNNGEANYNELKDFYNKTASTYEKIHQENFVPGTYFEYVYSLAIAKTLGELITDRQARILDVGCGSGKTGMDVKSLGFTNIDGADGSKELLDIAREKDVYKNYYEVLIGTDELPLPKDYQGIISAGAFLRGHIMYSAIPRLLELLVPGGFLVIYLFDKCFVNYKECSLENLQAVIGQCMKEGKCTELPSRRCTSVKSTKFSYQETGTIIILQRC